MYGSIKSEEVRNDLTSAPYVEVADEEERRSVRPAMLVGAASLLGVAAFAASRSAQQHSVSMLDSTSGVIDFKATNRFCLTLNSTNPCCYHHHFHEPWLTFSYLSHRRHKHCVVLLSLLRFQRHRIAFAHSLGRSIIIPCV